MNKISLEEYEAEKRAMKIVNEKVKVNLFYADNPQRICCSWYSCDEDKNGRRFVAFPCREKSNGEYEDIAFPVNSDFYHEVTNEILSEYNRSTNVNANSMGKF